MRLNSVHNYANGQAQKRVDLPHPLGVTTSQVVIDRDDMYPLACQGIQVHRQRRNQRFTFAGFHLSNFALVKHNTTDKLYVIMAHFDFAPAYFAHHGEGFGQQVIERFACPVAPDHFRHELIHRLGFKGIDLRLQLLQYLAEQLLEPLVCSLIWIGCIAPCLFKMRPGRGKSFVQFVVIDILKCRFNLFKQRKGSLLRVLGFIGPLLAFFRQVHSRRHS